MIEGKPVAFVAVLPVPGLTGAYRASRQVTLPDYQGVGVMSAMGNAIAAMYLAGGKKYFLSTSHPAQIAALKRSTRWICRAVKKSGSAPNGGKLRGAPTSTGRLQVSFQYVGSVDKANLSARGDAEPHKVE